MRWFKHDAYASNDPKLEKLRMKYGVEGYGLYFYCLELIARELTSNKYTFELEHDSEIIAHNLSMDSRKVEEILVYCVKQGLFEINEGNVITCFKLLKRLDDSTAKSPAIKKLIENAKEVADFGKIPKNSEEVGKTPSRIEKNRIEQNTKEKNIYIPPKNESEKIFNHWNNQEIIKHNKLTSDTTRQIQKSFKNFSTQDILDAITNYKQVLDSDKHFFNYKWTLKDFLSRGLERFLNESDPLGNLMHYDKKDSQTEKFYKLMENIK